jgi:hypothetical protein
MFSPVLLEMLVQSRLQELALADQRRRMADPRLHHPTAPEASRSPALVKRQCLSYARCVAALRGTLAAVC